nr:immunoglobulin light chain junction region [Mus musculus]
CHQRSSYRTF